MKQPTLPIVFPKDTTNHYGKRRLNRFKIVNGIKYQLHATRGWKKIGRVEVVR